jgi:hypothetical protein
MKPDLRPHAEQRCQQRAVPTLVAALLLDYGTCIRHAGADVLYVDKPARRRIQEAVGGGRNLALVERWLNSYAVVGDDGRIITVARRTVRLKRP